MSTMKDVYKASEPLINEILRKEMVAQGHHLTGAMEESLSSVLSTIGNSEVMEGYAVHYAQFVNDGFPAKSASFKQLPFLIEYFVLRGHPLKEIL